MTSDHLGEAVVHVTTWPPADRCSGRARNPRCEGNRASGATDLATTTASLALQPELIAFFEGVYGPYPFDSYGAIVDDDSVGYALETQTRPIYSRVAQESTVAHGLAHQRVGNGVSPESWAPQQALR